MLTSLPCDGKRGVTFFGYNLTVKQAVADGDGSVRTLERHTLFKGPALDRGLIAGRGVYLDSFLKGAAGDGFVVDHHPLEGTVGDGAVVVHILLEGTAGDGAGVAHHPLEGAAGDGLVVVPPPGRCRRIWCPSCSYPPGSCRRRWCRC